MNLLFSLHQEIKVSKSQCFKGTETLKLAPLKPAFPIAIPAPHRGAG
jgi:hypothetical protein